MSDRTKQESVLSSHMDDDSDEMAFLGALLAYPAETIALLGASADPALFTSPRCRMMFEAFAALTARGAHTTVFTLTDEIRNRGEMVAIGGPVQITRLVSEFSYTPAVVEPCLARMRHKAALRLAAEDAQFFTDAAGSWGTDPTALAVAMRERADRLEKVSQASTAVRIPMLEFLTPSQLRAFDPPAGWNMVGDYHIQRTSAFVIGGPPGTGKSRALTYLALAGATAQPFFGMQVHRRFKTMILQCENGRVRLKNELSALGPDVDDFIRYSPPPPFGFAFTNDRFLRELRDAVDEFRPDVFAIDPWNRLARDDRGKDYKEAFDAILSVLPTGDDCPAIGVIAHTRKPQVGERADGRALLNLLAGSYILGSVPRSAFILQPASDDGNDDRCVWVCSKNNDGQLGDRSAWVRQNGLFAPCPDFDWSEFDGPREDTRRTITDEHMNRVFDGGRTILSRAEATRKLEEITGFTKTPCYNALSASGKFAERLTEKKKLLHWK